MVNKRTYGDACGVARALDIVGERWTLMIVRELLLGPKRFTDIRTGLPHLGPDVLAQRLRELDAAGLIRRRTLPPPAASQVYELTDRGLELEPVVIALGNWGARLPMPPPDMTMSFDSHLLTLRTLFDPVLAGDFDARVQLLLDGEPFRAEVSAGRFSVERGEHDAPDVSIETGPGTLVALTHGRSTLADAQRAGTIAITGDKAAARRFLKLFPLPEPAPVHAPAPVPA